VRQFSLRALDDPAVWAQELDEMHRRWEWLAPLGLPLGGLLVEAFDRLGFFRVFSTPWFLLLLVVLTISIVVCTLDRLPRLWRETRPSRVEQPAAFFDSRLDHRARLEAGAPGGPGAPAATADLLADAFRARGFGVRRATAPDGSVAWVHGDRNRRTRLATLVTHAGLVLFLVGGAVTVGFGYETVLFVGEGQTAPVQPVGTPGNLLVKNLRFEAPRRPDGSFEDFRTDLAVYRDGELVARRTIRVNEPLEVDGFVFHQNTFGPAADLVIRTAEGELAWEGPVVLAGDFLGRPQGFLTIPGSDVGLLVLLERGPAGDSRLVVQGILGADGGAEPRTAFLGTLPVGATTDPSDTLGFAITWQAAGAWTGMVVKRDPGAPVIWVAFLLLLGGLSLTFYFPRRRAWARVEGGTVDLAVLADRYVDVGRELAALRDEASARLRPDRPAPGPG
jgi:cytochrome c biogenesis protein